MVTWHPACGAPVELRGGLTVDPDGAEHLCRDYLAWHLPADRRHPDDIPSPYDAVPRRPVPVELTPAA